MSRYFWIPVFVNDRGSMDASSSPLLQFQLNQSYRCVAYDAAHAAILSRAGEEAARAEIERWTGYSRTPLLALPDLADELQVAAIDYKDESGRFGLGSFKALGGAYAVFRVLSSMIERATGSRPQAEDLIAGHHREITSAVTVTCATDGNHGRSVAWGARLFGSACVIYVHATVSEQRVRAIEQFGARVNRTPGSYDDAVRRAAADAAAHSWIVVSDTSYPGYLEVPRHVMQGYSVMVEEAIVQMAERGRKASHVFIQGGVGGLAAAVTAHFWESFGTEAPRVVVVEPDRAACLFASAAAGFPTAVGGDLDTIMAGLACGEVSLLAWEILRDGAAAFMTISDEAAIDVMRLLASGRAGASIVAGESGVAGLAGLRALADRTEWRRAIALDSASTVLVFGTEGDTDPQLYRRLVGRSADEVRSQA